MSFVKPVYVRTLFDKIAPVYDLLNNIMSFCLHKKWKKKAVKLLNIPNGALFLDLCCGSGDISAIACSMQPEICVKAVDFSPEMLKIAQKKLKNKENVEFMCSDALNLPFEENYFDCLAISFGLRNLKDIDAGLNEMYRVLKPSGKMFNLDFGKPDMLLFRLLFAFYFDKIVPILGFLFKKSEEYVYLGQSIKKFSSPRELKAIMLKTGFQNVQIKKLFFGFVSIQLATK